MTDVTGTTGNDILAFTGTLGQLTLTITNAYSSKSLFIDEEKNINDTRYDGLAGNDTLIMSNSGDALFITNSAGVQMIANIEQIFAGQGSDVIVLSHETITLGNLFIDGGANGDIIWSNVGDDTLRGLAGDDILDGGPGNDLLNGGNDNDTLHGGLGNDLLQGAQGDDTLEYSADAVWGAGYYTVNFNTGAEVALEGLSRSHDTFDGGTESDTIVMTAGNDALILDDPASPRHSSSSGARVVSVETIDAGDGDDVINLTSATYSYGNVTINGGAGNDVLWSGAGNDTLDGGDGDDILHGGAGDDNLLLSAGDDIYAGGAGFDRLTMTAGDDVFNFNGVNLDSVEAIYGGAGNDTINLDHAVSYGAVLIDGEDGADVIRSSSGDDTLRGGAGDDTLYGMLGDDRLEGGDGNDTLYGGDVPIVITNSHSFSNDVIFPHLTERQVLSTPEKAALGIAAGDLSVAYETTATIRFVESGAGYKNSLGFYSIAADGTIQAVEMAFSNVKGMAAGQDHQITLPGAPDTDFGFFIIADGYTHNKSYNGMDFENGELSFVYKRGTADERPATVYDSAADIALVYSNGGVEKVLKGPVYHTTERDGSLALNPDGKEHVVSGLVSEGGDTASAQFAKADVKGKVSSITKDGITLSTDDGIFSIIGTNLLGVRQADNYNSVRINGKEAVEIRMDHAAEKVEIDLGSLEQNSKHYGIDLLVYLNGDMDNPVVVELDTRDFYRDRCYGTITLNGADFGENALITGVDIASFKNSALLADAFTISAVRATTPMGTADDGVLRIGFEDLPCLGDADYNDVVFDLSIESRTTIIAQPGNDVLIGGAGDDVLYGGGGADMFVFTHLGDGVDRVMDFSLAEGDSLNITDILEDFDALNSAVADFVRLTQQGGDTVLEVDAGGTGADFTAAAIIAGGVGGATLADLINAGALIMDQSAVV